jgi:hypothetical protein
MYFSEPDTTPLNGEGIYSPPFVVRSPPYWIGCAFVTEAMKLDRIKIGMDARGQVEQMA